jgi:hypothetical protein
MEQKPTKDQVRTWLQKRQAQPSPLPDIDHIRQDVGWKAGTERDQGALGRKHKE